MPSGGGTANGTAIVIADCTGAAGQQWTATSTNTLKHVSSGKCLDVPSSNSADGTDLQLYTCNGSSAQTWAPDKATKYIYGGDGQRLMTISSTERTLYLGESTISVNASGGPAYTERYYSQPGAPTVMRHAQGAGASELSVQITDQNGTAYANVALTSGNKVKFSKTDPFGVERSESSSWRSHQGYIGGDEDASSGLIHLGFREYDPSTGRFLSPDPVLDLADPVQMNGYVYCENNPVTFADPSGLASEGGGLEEYGGPSASEEAAAKQTLNTSLTDVILSVGWAALKQFIGWDDVVGCFSRGDLWACGSLFIQAIPWTQFTKIPAVAKAAYRIAKAVNAWMKAKEKARKVIELAKKARELARKAKEAKRKAAEKAAQLEKKAKEAATRKAKRDAQKTGNAVQKSKKTAAKNAESKPRQTKAKEEPSGNGSTCSREENSFVPGTKVLMADGTTKPIEQVKNGDKVLATDPETGETAVETVTAEIKGEGVKHLVKVTIATGKGTSVEVTATDGHPFWVSALGQWVDAKDLKAGLWLRTSAGTYVQVTAIKAWTTPEATVHNLTVSDLHTYYVVAGVTPILVHNCGGALLDRARELYATRADEASTVAVARVRNVNNPDRVETWVATERTGLPDEWKGGNAPLRGERYIPGQGHAEATIMNRLGSDWEIVGMASSTRMCPACLAQATSPSIGLTPSSIGMGTGVSSTGNTPWRVVLGGGG